MNIEIAETKLLQTVYFVSNPLPLFRGLFLPIWRGLSGEHVGLNG
jgi:hypothetical protein